MKYFSPDYLRFFMDLAGNNNRDWFQANKKRYEESVKKPFEKFTAALIQEVSKFDADLAIKPSDAIFRINRDIRFSKDKTPYKLNASAAIAPGGRKDMASSGIYVELGPEKLGIAGGIYMPDKDQVNQIRSAIARNPKAFMKLAEDKKFVGLCGGLQGEENKILAPEFKAIAETCPYIRLKQFYYWKEEDPEIILSDDLMKTILMRYKASREMGSFLNDALRNKRR